MKQDDKIKQEVLKNKERETLVLASDRQLRCKNCGSFHFYTFENKAYINKKDMFMVVECCANCGLIAHTHNMKGWIEEEYNKAPIDKKFLTIQKTHEECQQIVSSIFNEIEKYRQPDEDCNCKTCRFYKNHKAKVRGEAMKCKNCGHELVCVWVHKRAENDNDASHFDNPRPKHTGNYMKKWCDCPKAECKSGVK